MEENRIISALFRTIPYLYFAFLILALQVSHASTIERVAIEDTLFIDASINESIVLRVSDNNNSHFSFSLPEGAKDIIGDGQGYVNSTLEIPLDCEVCDISISYILSDVVKKEDEIYSSFSRTLNFPTAPGRIAYTIRLPPGFVIDTQNKTETDPPIVPQATKIATDGKSIMIVWEETDPELPKRYYVRYQEAPEQSRIVTFLKTLLGLVPIAVILFLAAGIALGFFLKGRLLKKKEKQEAIIAEEGKGEGSRGKSGENMIKKEVIVMIPSSLLSPDEKTVLKLIKDNEGKMNQKDVVKKLEWSKSKVSAIMTNLEYKQIIRREKFGRNYRVELIKEIEGL